MDGVLAPPPRDSFWLRSPVILSSVAIVALVAWEFAVRAEVLNPRHIAAPSAVFRLLLRDLIRPIGEGERNVVKPLSMHACLTVWRWLRGFGIAVGLGLTAGFVIASSRVARRVGFPIVHVLRALPSAAIWPITAVIAGFGTRSQLVVIAFGTLWPVLMDTANALAGLHQEIRDSLQFMHLHRWQRIWILTQLAAPGIFTGIEIGCSVAFLLSVTVEMLWPSDGGIGWYLSYFANQGDPTPLFAGVVLTAIVGWGLNTGLHYVRRQLLFWETDTEYHAVSFLRRALAAISPHGDRARAIVQIRDPRIAAIFSSDQVTEAIERQFGAFRLHVIRTSEPYFAPADLSRIVDRDAETPLQQRDVILEALIKDQYRPFIFAQSWVNEMRLTVAARQAVADGDLTLGQIVRGLEPTWRNEDIGFSSVISEDIGHLLGRRGALRALQRRRILSTERGEAILIHEYYPTALV